MLGQSILHYNILEKLGEGGMGVVYKAHDTRLKRDVAIKFLPGHIAASGEERERFRIEAQAAAALNHPNIATIHAIEELDDELFIVMEYVDGRELKDVIQQSTLEFREIQDYAAQIASGLLAAHRKNIVHRDIKSANIMIADDGLAKIMDFGLAKVRGGARVTKQGSTLGTAAYMSPEQARGEEVDHRTDIWAFGVALYEMLTGKLPFGGDFEQAVIYSILNEEPEPIPAIRPDVPEIVMKVVNRCLNRDLEQRYQNIDEVLSDLKQEAAAVSAPERNGRPTASGLRIAFAALGILFAAVLAWWISRPSHTELKIVSTRPLTSAPGFEGQPSWSPDGTRIAYMSNESGRPDIWVSQIGTGQSVNLTIAQPGISSEPAWSPVGDRIAFYSDEERGGIFTIPAVGGNARQILAVEQPSYGVVSSSWSPDASQLGFAADSIYVVPAEGGQRIRIPFDATGLFLQSPSWSPTGERLAFSEIMGTGLSTTKIWTIDLAGENAQPVTAARGYDQYPIWGPNGRRLLFVSDRGGSADIWWIGIDEKGVTSGEPEPLTAGVGVGRIALSKSGRFLAYEKLVQSSSIWKLPISSEGMMTLSDARLLSNENALIESIKCSPDGNWLAIDSNRSGNSDIWMLRTDGTGWRQITTDTAHDWRPTWSPDSRQIAFHSLRSGNRDIWIQSVAGGAAKQLTSDPRKEWQPAWSSTSDEIAYTSYFGPHPNVWIVSPTSPPFQLTFMEYPDLIADTWSPDGKQLVLVASRGADEIIFLSREDPAETMLLPTPLNRTRVFGMSRDGQVVYAVAGMKRDVTGNLYAIALEDGSVTQLTDFGNDPTRGLAWATHDGDHFYVVFNEQKSDLWIAELEEE